MSGLFHTFLYQPMYNAFIFLMDLLPGFDAGVIVILFTIIVRLVIFPLSKKAVVAQMELKAIQPELEAIRAKYKNDNQEQARRTLDLYREKKINPFSSILVLFIQLPIVFALYFVFLRSGLPTLNLDLLYSFVPHPDSIDMSFLGLVNILEKSVLLAICAGVSSFFQLRYSVPPMEPQKGERTFRDDFARSMNLQMRYVFPVIVLFIAYSISGVIALYWTTTNLFTLGQEIVIRRKLKRA